MSSNEHTKGKTASIRARLKYPTEEEFIEKYASNISKAGIFVKTARPRARGTRVKFEFQLANGDPVMRGLGEVSWTREDPEGDMHPGMGIKFLKLDAHSRQILGRVLEVKKLSESPPSPSVPPADDVSSADERAMAASTSPKATTAGKSEGAAKPTKAHASMPKGRRQRAKFPEVDPMNLEAIDSMLAELATDSGPRKRRTGRRYRSSYPPGAYSKDARISTKPHPPQEAVQPESSAPKGPETEADPALYPSSLPGLKKTTVPVAPEPTRGETADLQASLDSEKAKLTN